MDNHPLIQNELLTYWLGEIINTLTQRYDDGQVRQLLYWLGGTIGKWYDEEEQAETIKENCREWFKDPNCFNK